jgi:hypothetical protein
LAVNCAPADEYRQQGRTEKRDKIRKEKEKGERYLRYKKCQREKYMKTEEDPETQRSAIESQY